MLKRLASRIASSSLGLLLPRACFSCGTILSEEPSDESEQLGLCPDCWRDLPLFDSPCCSRCAAPLVLVAGDKPLPCHRCNGHRYHFDEAIAAGEYDGLLRNLVLRTKRASEEAAALGLGRLMWRRAGERLAELMPDAVAATPMHWRRRLVRQTNAPELMAEFIGRQRGAPFAPRLLRRTRPTRQQTSLPSSSRLPNVRSAFAMRRGFRVEGATIVLIDDILTTGATCSEAARALKTAGAARVVVVVAAKSL